MKMMNGLLGLAIVAGLAVATPASAVVSYSDLSTVGLAAPSGRVSYLSAITPAGTGLNTLSAMTFGVGVAANSAASTQGVFVDFYQNIDLSTTTTDALASSTYLGGFSGTLNITANTSTTSAFRAFSFSNLNTLATPVAFQLGGTSNFGVVVTLTDSTGTFYSTVLSGLTNTVAPTVGTAYNRIWSDANLNGFFAGSEQSAAGVYSYLSLTTLPAATAVPEPATWGMLILGFGMIGAASRRRRGTAYRAA